MTRRLFAWMQKYERHLSALAMVAGFVVDNLYFKRIDLWETQIVFVTYAAICFVTIPLLHFIEARAAEGKERPRWRPLLPIATQFALGGFWSGFFVFYGRAAVLSISWPFLLLLAAVLIGNEFLRRYHDRVVFTTVLFFLAIYSYFIFAVPIYTKEMSTLTFIGSGLIAVLVFTLFTILLRILGSARFKSEVWKIRAGAAVVFLLINVFYFTNVLPPLPLTAKAAGVYHAVWRVPGDYMAIEEEQPWQVKYLGFKPTIHAVPGESLYAYSSVFAPTELSTIIVHRWQLYDEPSDQWTTKAAISYPIVGGRDGGYKGYSAVLALPGTWRVNIETTDGRLIERLAFKVEKASLPPESETITLP